MFVFDDRWYQMPEVPLRIIVKFVEDFWKIEEERKRQEEESSGWGSSYGDRG